MMMKIIVTGINGFVGHHVAVALHQSGFLVVGIGNQEKVNDDLKDIVKTYIRCDLTLASDVEKIKLSEVDAIINLAGLASVGGSFGNGEQYNKVNVGVHTTLYEECLKQNAKPRIVAVSTGAVYNPNQPLPITESSSLAKHQETNEYVVSKLLMEDSLAPYASRGLKIIIARPFNHSGPGQLPGFLLPDLSQQIENALKEGQPLMVGNLDTKRDFTDVRDVARAYVELATCDESKLKHTIYNICSGSSISGKEMLRFVMDTYGASNMTTEIDPSRIRTNEIMEIYGSRERITQDIGWEPTISVQQMVEDFVEWKRQNHVEKN
jgi:GDP-4-dehydro-6-deoxy-D-mannose reductase